MNTAVFREDKENSDRLSYEQDWFTTLSHETFVDSPESLNLTIADNYGESTLTPLVENDRASLTYSQEPELPEFNLGDSDYSLFELGGFTSSSYISGANHDPLLDFNGSSQDDSSTTYPDDFLNIERENETHCFTDHDYARRSSSPPRMPLIEVNANNKGAHYQIFNDAVTVINFDPSLNTRAGTRVPFRTVSKMQITDKIYIFAQYCTDTLSSQSPFEQEDPLPVLPSIKIDDNELQRIREGRIEFRECKCFRSHPTAAFCVTSEKAKVAWCDMSGVPVAILTVKEESVVDLSIGFWSTKILNEHNLGGKKVFNQIVCHIFDRASIIRKNLREQRFFYKTCASVTRDINGFYKEVEKAFPQRPRLDLIPDASENLSSHEQNRSCGRRKKLKTAGQIPLKV